MFLVDFHYQFTEQRIRPGEPRTGKFSRVIHMEGFMHETCICIGILQQRNTTPDFLLIGRCKSLSLRNKY